MLIEDKLSIAEMAQRKGGERTRELEKAERAEEGDGGGTDPVSACADLVLMRCGETNAGTWEL